MSYFLFKFSFLSLSLSLGLPHTWRTRGYNPHRRHRLARSGSLLIASRIRLCGRSPSPRDSKSHQALSQRYYTVRDSPNVDQAALVFQPSDETQATPATGCRKFLFEKRTRRTFVSLHFVSILYLTFKISN